MPHFIKLGGSLITDKNQALTPRPQTIRRLAHEFARVWQAQPQQQWVLSHGSGSYGHAAAQQHRTRQGVQNATGWAGFAQVGHVAAQLNRLVMAELLSAGVPAISFAPSALARCHNRRITHLHTPPILTALRHQLVPVLFGDVAFDDALGGTIVSTEEVLAALAQDLPPRHLTLVGLVDGVFDADPVRHPRARHIPHLRLADLPALRKALGDSHGVDVTGGMAGKIDEMARLLRQFPQTHIHLISGEEPGHFLRHLQNPELPLGTTLTG
jgi:isopentenyl phosphate kinase